MNKKIIEQFTQLVKQIQSEQLNAQLENNLKEGNMHKFRLQNVKRVLSVIKKLDFEIKDANDLKGIPGVGAGTIRRIKEILETGYLSELSNKYDIGKNTSIKGIEELTQVIGIGESLAKKLVIENNITTVEQLKSAIKKNKISVNDKIKLGLKYYGVVEGKIPREETSKVEKYLKKEATKIDSDLEIMICGSYRRQKEFSGDIDVLMFHPKMKTMKELQDPEKFNLKSYLELFVEHLKDKEFLLDDMAFSTMKYMGFCQYKKNPVRRIDIRLVPYQSRYTAMLYFTGPFELNTEMRRRAEKRGMFLNEYGLYKIDKDGEKIPIKINSEEEVFEKLSMVYLTPEERQQYSEGTQKKL